MKTFELVEIDDIQHHSKYDGKVYDLTVEDDHSYNVDGIVVHNSVCTTRIQTGVGYPQLSAILECAQAAHALGAHIIADGGCTCPGDVAKAFGAGADFVMLGSMLAGHDEGNGEVIDTPNGKFVQFYGMSSTTAMEKHHGGVADYRSSEGRTVLIPYKGSVDNTVKNILGGLRSTCTYVGAKNLEQLAVLTTFIRVNNQYNRIHENKTISL